jgi:spermidine synthase
MVDTARDPRYFTFIKNCAPDLQPVMGDARLTFAREPDGIYDLIIVDAYSSDAIPIHLATEEAMKIYKDKLAPQGVVLMHVSNRHLDLASVVVGDARRMLARQPDGRYDLILVDAFSSDTIPIHLITRDAMAMFKRKLAPQGVVLMHVSNRYLELESVVAGVAAANGLRSWVTTGEGADGDDPEYVFSSDVVIAAESANDIGELAESKAFAPSLPDPTQRVWTDDYSNIIGAVWRK